MQLLLALVIMGVVIVGVNKVLGTEGAPAATPVWGPQAADGGRPEVKPAPLGVPQQVAASWSRLTPAERDRWTRYAALATHPLGG